MKVKDLIKKLESMNQEAYVIVSSSNFEKGNIDELLLNITQHSTGNRTLKQFRDAFDGESYTSEVWSIFGGDLPVVKLN